MHEPVLVFDSDDFRAVWDKSRLPEHRREVRTGRRSAIHEICCTFMMFMCQAKVFEIQLRLKK